MSVTLQILIFLIPFTPRFKTYLHLCVLISDSEFPFLHNFSMSIIQHSLFISLLFLTFVTALRFVCKLPSHLISINPASHGYLIQLGPFLFPIITQWPWTSLQGWAALMGEAVLTEPATFTLVELSVLLSTFLFPSCWLTAHPTQQFLQTFLTLFKIQALFQIWPQKTFPVSSLPKLFALYIPNTMVVPPLIHASESAFLKGSLVCCKYPCNVHYVLLDLANISL